MTGATELYDVGTGTWQLGPLVEGWMSPTAVALGDGRALVIDGMGSIAMYDPTRSTPGPTEYDPTMSTPGPTVNAAHGFQSTATLLASGKVLICGGVILNYPGPSDILAFAHLYEPS